MIEHLFVYGTLLPGEVRWQYLEPFVIDDGQQDCATGTLFDTGEGYPAALFGGSGTIHGRRFAMRPDLLWHALERLDEVEGAVAGLYRRIEITTASGHAVWTYEYGRGLELQPIASGRWVERSRQV